MIFNIASSLRNKLTVFTDPVIKTQPSLSLASFFYNKLSTICSHWFKFSIPLCTLASVASGYCLFQIFFILTSASASSFLIIFSLPFMDLLRRSVNNFIVLFLEYVTLWHMFFNIRHRLIGIILELTHIKSCQSRILPKLFIKLFLVITRKVYRIQLFFWKVVKPLV